MKKLEIRLSGKLESFNSRFWRRQVQWLFPFNLF
jgi:hypothetical protein